MEPEREEDQEHPEEHEVGDLQKPERSQRQPARPRHAGGVIEEAPTEPGHVVVLRDCQGDDAEPEHDRRDDARERR
jgi:hypothetical protein